MKTTTLANALRTSIINKTAGTVNPEALAAAPDLEVITTYVTAAYGQDAVRSPEMLSALIRTSSGAKKFLSYFEAQKQFEAQVSRLKEHAKTCTGCAALVRYHEDGDEGVLGYLDSVFNRGDVGNDTACVLKNVAHVMGYVAPALDEAGESIEDYGFIG